MSLRVRLLLLVLASLVPAFGAIAYMAGVHREQAADHAHGDAITLARLAAREHARLIESTRRLLISVSGLPGLAGHSPSECAAALTEHIMPYPYYTNLGVADAQGAVWCSAVTANGKVNIADRSYFQRAVQSLGFGIGDYQVGRITGIPAVNFGYAITGDTGAVQAVVYAAVDLSWLERLAATVDIPAETTLTVLDSAGTVLARYPEPADWVGRSVQQTALARALRHLDPEDTAELKGLDGVPRLYAFARLFDGPSGVVYVTVGIPTAVAFARVGEALMSSLLVLLIAGALASAAAWAGSRLFVLRPVDALAAAARRLAGGDLSARTGLAHGADELGRLAHGFDDMAAVLQRTTRALRTLSAGNQTLVRASEEQALLEDMCRIVVEVGGYPAAWVGFVEHDARRTVRPVAQCGIDGGLASLADALRELTWADAEHGRGPAATAVRTGERCVVHDLAADPGFAPWRDSALVRGFASCAAFPLREEGAVIGVLVIYANETDAFDDKELDVLAESAADLAFGIAGLRTRAAHTQAVATISRMAFVDRLTGLPNHDRFGELLRDALRQAQLRARPLSVLLVDLKRLRWINDAFGFEQGDEALKQVAVRICSTAGENGIVARLRGGEFGVLLNGVERHGAVAAAQAILDQFTSPFVVDQLELDLSATVGIALSPEHGNRASELLRCANVALHQAKRMGDSYAAYASESDHDTAHRLVLARELRRAIEDDQLVLHFQPKVDLASRRLVGAEALARWNHPERGIIPPDEFIPLAEHTGLIQALTQWVMASALRQASRWRDAGLHIPVAVNLSARNLHDPEIVDKVQRLLTAWASEPGWLELEITESSIMMDSERALSAVTGLNRLGINLFVDDFGTGYSSLSYLHRLPVSAVKIDKSFVKDMLVNPDSVAIVRSTITLAHEMGIRAIAEGVEDLDTLDALAEMRCDEAQGYYIGRPMPSGQFDEWLATAPWQMH